MLPDVRYGFPFCASASVDVEGGASQGSSSDCEGGVILIRLGPEFERSVQTEREVAADKSMPCHQGRRLPFAQRLTCTVAEACEVTGLGRTKIYELIGDGRVTTTTVGRRRLVMVQSLLALVGVNMTPANRA
ncbi:excisionase family DNA-binding protein [Bradyrhizobium yuanmingense]|uniref:excisionase family DNA-binding protein n=2 Tax=Bradyrhizobium yuanmingense TaxID=108015 RepID=UPI0009D9AB01